MPITGSRLLICLALRVLLLADFVAGSTTSVSNAVGKFLRRTLILGYELSEFPQKGAGVYLEIPPWAFVRAGRIIPCAPGSDTRVPKVAGEYYVPAYSC